MADLPAGFVYHCDTCKIVVPEDAPRPDGGDCAWVADHRMAWFDPTESVKGQHTMASAAWHLIYHAAFKAAKVDPAVAAYLQRHKTNPVEHFRRSRARQALTPQELEQQRTIKPIRDAAFYKD